MVDFPALLKSSYFINEIARSRDRLLEELLAVLRRRVPEVTVVLVQGDPAQKIADYALAHDVDLVLMGKRGLRSIRRLVLGRNTRRVLRSGRVPTLVVPSSCSEHELTAPPTRYRQIIAATDLGRTSRLNLAATLCLAEQLDAGVEYLHVLRLPLAVGGAGAKELIPEEELAGLHQALSNSLVDAVGSGACRCEPKLLVDTSVCEAISRAIERSGAGLITVPAHGAGTSDGTIGTTVENIIRLASTPVLVFPVEYLSWRFE